MNRKKTLFGLFIVSLLVLTFVAQNVNAYMMYGYPYSYGSYGYSGYPGYYPSRNYYMMDYYYQRPYPSSYYDPYRYSYSPYYGGSYVSGYYSSYYRDPYWKYYALDSFMRSPRYGFY